MLLHGAAGWHHVEWWLVGSADRWLVGSTDPWRSSSSASSSWMHRCVCVCVWCVCVYVCMCVCVCVCVWYVCCDSVSVFRVQPTCATKKKCLSCCFTG
jgi:lipopolysaccharide/colanic/teichoic acid biosynthesis glycosyltransferase